MIALVGVYFVLEELLVQQSKLLWDDIRDRERDRVLLQNKGRAIARGALSLEQALWNIVVRLALVALFVFWQQRGDLLVVFSLILLHQAVYLWAKSRGARHPLLLLLWLSFNNALRFLAGVVAILGFKALLPFVFAFVVFYFCSVGGLAAQWKMEAEYAGKDIRPQGAYFLVKGDFWQHVGLINAVLVSFLLFFVLSFSSCNRQLLFLQSIDRFQCDSGYADIGIAGGVLVLLLIGIFLLLGMALVSLVRRGRGNRLLGISRKMKDQALLILGFVVLASLVYIIISYIFPGLKNYNILLVIFILFIINMMYMILYEGMTYPEFANVGRMVNKKGTGTDENAEGASNGL